MASRQMFNPAILLMDLDTRSLFAARSADLPTCLSAAAKPLVAPRAHPSPFFKEGDPEHLRFVYPHEAHVDFPSHWKALRGAEAKIAAALRAERPRTIRAMASQMAKALIAGKRPSGVVLNTGAERSSALQAILDPLYQTGRQAVREESQRLEGARRAAAFAGRQALAADVPLIPNLQSLAPKKSGGLFADIAAQFFDETIGNDAANAGIEALKKYGPDVTDQDVDELEDELYGAIADNADGFCDTIADSAARGTFRAGRGDAFDEIRQELAKQGYELRTIRICAMEKNSCDPCIDANGQTVTPGEDLSAICLGKEACECEEGESI